LQSKLFKSVKPAIDGYRVDGFEPHRVTKKAKPSENRGFAFERYAQRDSIPPHIPAGKVGVGDQSGAQSGARGDVEAVLAEDDPDLAVIVAGWSKLSADVRRAVVELVEAELGAEVEFDREG
jgi:hypothetical protein